MASMLLVVPPALLLDPIFDPLVDCVIALLEWHKVLNYEIHTEATIAELRSKRIALQEALLENLSGIRGGRDWKILKFFVLRKFEECIMFIASAAYTDTGFLELLHKYLKPSARFTNNHTNQMASQVSEHARRAAAARRILDAVKKSNKTERNRMMKRAVQTGQLALPSRCLIADTIELSLGNSSTDQATLDLLAVVPELEHLSFSISEYSKELELALPQPRVAFYATAGHPHYRRIGGTLEGIKLRTSIYDNTGYSSVAVRAPGYTPENQLEYYADVIAFIVLDYGGTCRSPPLVFLRWYEKDNEEDIDPAVLQQLKRLKMPLLKVQRQVRPKAGGGTKP